MKCPKCGNKIKDIKSPCPTCGKKMTEREIKIEKSKRKSQIQEKGSSHTGQRQ